MRGEQRVEDARTKVSTGQRINKPSDAPADIAELLRVNSEIGDLNARSAAVKAAIPIATAGEEAMGDITTALRQVKTIALQAANGATSSDQDQLLADQVARITERIRVSANTQVNGSYVFAGTNSNQEPFPAGPPITYTGNNNPMQVAVTVNQPFAYTATGQQVLGSNGGTDLFKTLDDLQTAIRSGDGAGISTGLDNVDAQINNSIRVRGDLGSRIQYLQLATTTLGDAITNVQHRQSDLKDVDLAQAAIEAQTASTSQQATLLAAANLQGPTLLDYLR